MCEWCVVLQPTSEATRCFSRPSKWSAKASSACTALTMMLSELVLYLSSGSKKLLDVLDDVAKAVAATPSWQLGGWLRWVLPERWVLPVGWVLLHVAAACGEWGCALHELENERGFCNTLSYTDHRSPLLQETRRETTSTIHKATNDPSLDLYPPSEQQTPSTSSISL